MANDKKNLLLNATIYCLLWAPFIIQKTTGALVSDEDMVAAFELIYLGLFFFAIFLCTKEFKSLKFFDEKNTECGNKTCF